MLENPNLLLEIKGYASDSLSNDLENLALSSKRANTVKDILIRNFNIQPIRISAKGYGNEPFVFSKNHYVERQLNRGVYIVTTEKIGIVIGMLVYGIIDQITGSPRLGIASLALFFVIAVFLLNRIPKKGVLNH